MPTGDEMEAGHGTSASDPTVILAHQGEDGNTNFKAGRAVFEAGPTDVFGKVPLQPFIGLLGRGSPCRAGSGPLNTVPAMPGVVGFGGDPAGPFVDFQGGSGVIGFGGNSSTGTGMPPGPGIYGVGGHSGGAQLSGAGVIGVSAGHSVIPWLPELPAFSDTFNVGVFGIATQGAFLSNKDTVGVRGQTDYGTGVHGVATGIGRGGVFHSKHSAQVQLAPYDLQAPLPAPTPIQAKAIPTERDSGPELPKDGQPGDLMAVLDDQRECTLWSCVRGRDGEAVAQWAQVLLGPAFDGRK